MLSDLYHDAEMSEIWSESTTVNMWLRTEAELARAQAEHGLFSRDIAEGLAAALILSNVDLDRLWRDTKVVGYPILPLTQQISEAVSPEVGGRLHYGATTQDIMDTGLSLQLKASISRLRDLLLSVGDALAASVSAHRHTIMAARTHNQQAVPTTLGAKWAGYLDEVARHLVRLTQLEDRLCRVSLFGAGGTAAALGPTSASVRERLAALLNLQVAGVSWHAARDSVAEYLSLCILLSHTAARFAREVSNLSRTEIGEVLEPGGYHRGASSTMPQKSNPITSEVILGLANLARGSAIPGYSAMLVEHERAAGEWQIEWDALPQTSCLTATALAMAAELIPTLRVFPEVMSENMRKDGGLVMSEAYMIRLVESMGKGPAHDLVYEAAVRARKEELPLPEVLFAMMANDLWRETIGDCVIDPSSYLGECESVVEAVLAAWSELRAKREA